jgi:hypothetical protein
MANRYTGLLPRSQVSAPARRARLLDCLASPRLLASLRGATRPRLSLGCCLCLSLSTVHVVSTWIADGVGVGGAGAAVAISLELGAWAIRYYYQLSPPRHTPPPWSVEVEVEAGGAGGQGQAAGRPGTTGSRSQDPPTCEMRGGAQCTAHSSQQPVQCAVCRVQPSDSQQPGPQGLVCVHKNPTPPPCQLAVRRPDTREPRKNSTQAAPEAHLAQPRTPTSAHGGPWTMGGGWGGEGSQERNSFLRNVANGPHCCLPYGSWFGWSAL